MHVPLCNNVDSIHFAAIDEQPIHKATMQTKGSFGPSHVDSDQFRCILSSGHFKAEGKELQKLGGWWYLKISHVTQENPEYSIPVEVVFNSKQYCFFTDECFFSLN